MSIISCFSEMLESIMFNRLCKYLTKNNFLYYKQFRFQKGYSTEHEILQVVEQINQSFEKNEFTLNVFADLSKAFHTVDHQNLLKKYNITVLLGII